MSDSQIVIFIVLPIVGYLLGSIPFAWVIGKAKGVDIRTVGSKNIGATNLGRTLGPQFFWYAFLLDAAKGFVPVLVASLLMHYLNRANGWTTITPASATTLPSTELPSWAPLITGIACVVGHLFPLYLKFKGGKGVATGFGVVLGFWPLYTIAGVLAGAFFVFMLMVYRYISLASMTAATAFAILVAVLGTYGIPYVADPVRSRDLLPLIGVACLFAAMIVFRHRANIGRLMKGTEPQIGHREIDKSKMNKP